GLAPSAPEASPDQEAHEGVRESRETGARGQVARTWERGRGEPGAARPGYANRAASICVYQERGRDSNRGRNGGENALGMTTLTQEGADFPGREDGEKARDPRPGAERGKLAGVELGHVRERHLGFAG